MGTIVKIAYGKISEKVLTRLCLEATKVRFFGSFEFFQAMESSSLPAIALVQWFESAIS